MFGNDAFDPNISSANMFKYGKLKTVIGLYLKSIYVVSAR